MDNIFELNNVCKSYKDFGLKNVNLSLEKGYIMGFVGANGAGKSTTINCLLGLSKVDSGTVKIFGKEKLDISDKEKIGVVLDGCPFAEILNLKDIEKILKNTYKSWDSEKFTEFCQKFSIPENKKIKDFSTGMIAKLNIATAICHNPQLLVLDEPTSGLDPVVRDEILDVLLDFIQNENNSVLISSHITSDLEKVCDYIAFIKDGEIVFVENKDQLTEKYAIIHCKNDELETLDKSGVIGYKQSKFSTQALVYVDKINGDFVTDKPTIEDIMLYYTKEAK